MTDPTDLAAGLESIRRALTVVAADRPTPEQIAEWNAADKAMAQRIRVAVPGVPLHHAYAVLQALRVTQRLDAAAAPVPAVQAPATDQTCDGCGHRLHAANLCLAVTYAEPCVCDEGAPATDDTDLTEADVDRMMATGTPVQIVTGPPATYGATPATDQTAPADWIDGHPQLEAIAAKGQVPPTAFTCGLCEVLDAPAAVALPASVDRAAVLREEAALIRAHCPDHLDAASAEGAWMDCHCDVADDMERRSAAESAPADAAHDDSETEGDALRCVCGETAVRSGDDWVHEPGKGGTCLYRPKARPRCPACQTPHDLTPGGMAMRACASILASLADRAAAAQQPKKADRDRVVAYRSPAGTALYCTRHYDELGPLWPPVLSEDLPDGGLCTKCGADVLIPQQPKKVRP
jgi:hypothetical protein